METAAPGLSQLDIARQRTETSTLNVVEKMKCGVTQIIFQNQENPGSADSLGELEFDFLGQHWDLVDQETYELPDPVIRHLNSLVVEEFEYLRDPTTGVIDAHNPGSVRKIHRRRFSCLQKDIVPAASQGPPARPAHATASTKG
jgi:hypothetical protein